MKRRILIIDDSATSRMVLQSIVRTAGYETSEAADAEHGVTMALEERPDIVLLDVLMPGMDGLTACRVLRDKPETRHMPIILVTTQSAEGSVEAGFTCGCSDYVLKPADEAELLAKIANCLSALPPSA